MKKEVNILRWIIIVAVTIIALMAAFAVAFNFVFEKEQVNYNGLTEVGIRHTGTMIPNGDEYKLSLQDGVWVASYNKIEWFEDNIQEKSVDEVFVNEIKRILSDNKVHKWDGFNKKNEFVTDGEKFIFYMCFSDGTKIEASGYMVYPKNFDSVFGAFKEKYTLLFES